MHSTTCSTTLPVSAWRLYSGIVPNTRKRGRQQSTSSNLSYRFPTHRGTGTFSDKLHSALTSAAVPCHTIPCVHLLTHRLGLACSICQCHIGCTCTHIQTSRACMHACCYVSFKRTRMSVYGDPLVYDDVPLPLAVQGTRCHTQPSTVGHPGSALLLPVVPKPCHTSVSTCGNIRAAAMEWQRGIELRCS